MKPFKLVFTILAALLLLGGCAPASGIILATPAQQSEPPEAPMPSAPVSTPVPASPAPALLPLSNPSPNGQGVLHFTVMVHLEGWKDDENEEKFIRHAQVVRDMADLFEKYGAKLTLESKEFTAGCIAWGDNVLLEMEQRGHGIGVHADIGGSKRTTQRQMETGLTEMKRELESLGVTVRHASGIVSDKDWVSACLSAGFEAATGVVSYALWSLPEELRPEGFEEYETPGQGHAPYPWDDTLCVLPWQTSSGENWIFSDPDGELIIFPSGISLTGAFEDETQGTAGAGTFVFDDNDIAVWRRQLTEMLACTDSGRFNTYYAAYSLGAVPDMAVLEQWLQMVDEFVQRGRIEWTTVPEMIDLYHNSK